MEQTIRSIQSVLPAMKVNMGGILLDQGLPQQALDQIDPFLLVHHLKLTYDGGERPEEVGVPPHPHRGFAPVTFIFEGGVHHRDSLDTSSVVYKGGTQWMHAGSGVVHSERPPKEVVEQGKTWELIQFWVNVPARFKMTPPAYQPLSYEETPRELSADGKVRVGVVAGKFGAQRGKVETYSPLMALRLDFEAGGRVRIPIPISYNAFVYQLDGRLLVNNEKETQAKDLCRLANDGDYIELEARETTRAILLAGEPIGEPLVTYGPFVMNSEAEIRQAMMDYQMGKMGQLVEKFD